MYYLEDELETSENEMLFHASETTQFIGNERFSPSSNDGINEYFTRIFHCSQMDFQWAFWQMCKLCTQPSSVAKYTKHRKQRKNRWARDDPAFVVILLGFMVVSSTAYSVAFGSSFALWFRGVIKSLLVDFLLVGFIISTINWFIANQYLIVQRLHTVDQKTEWLYSFDVHCNSYVPYFFISHVLVFFLTPLLLHDTTPSLLVSNTLYLLACCSYFYITFLGYHALPFLSHAESFLYPIAILVCLYVLTLLSRYNIIQVLLDFYYD